MPPTRGAKPSHIIEWRYSHRRRTLVSIHSHWSIWWWSKAMPGTSSRSRGGPWVPPWRAPFLGWGASRFPRRRSPPRVGPAEGVARSSASTNRRRSRWSPPPRTVVSSCGDDCEVPPWKRGAGRRCDDRIPDADWIPRPRRHLALGRCLRHLSWTLGGLFRTPW